MRLILMPAILVAVSIPQSIQAKSNDAAQAAYGRKDYGSALKLWLPRATRGEMAAQLAVGELYFYGTGIKQNYSLALVASQGCRSRKPRSPGRCRLAI